MSCLWFGVFYLTPFNPVTNDLCSLGPPSKDCVRTTEVGALSPRSEITRKLTTSPQIINEKVHKGLELYTEPGITKLPMAYTAGHVTQTTGKTKAEKQASADRTPTDTPEYATSHSCALQVKQKPKNKTHLLHYNKAQVTATRNQQTTEATFPTESKKKKKDRKKEETKP